MNLNPKPIRIEPALADREQVRAMFMCNAPYRALAAYAPEGIKGESREQDKKPPLPWFRGDWALGGEPLVDGAERILHNRKFVEAAKAAFGTPLVCPEFVAVNINGPGPAGNIHMDNPSFYGATRADYPLPFLRVMGFSGLFDAWRVVRASTLCWFYEGSGGNFDYWPEGLDGPMRTEQPPFGNIALCVDTDRVYHRIGAIGNDGAELPPMSALAEIQPDGNGNWTVLENGEVCAIYPSHAIRFSILWKAEVRDDSSKPENLNLDWIMAIFTTDLRHRGIDFYAPSDPLADPSWILLLQRIYTPPTATPNG
jgi:hypothetical protein